MKKIEIVPVGKKLLLEIPETSAGSIQVIQGAQIQEQGKIVAVGPAVNWVGDSSIKPLFEVGDVIQFKAWAVDCITIDKNKYYYISADSDAICGKVK